MATGPGRRRNVSAEDRMICLAGALAEVDRLERALSEQTVEESLKGVELEEFETTSALKLVDAPGQIEELAGQAARLRADVASARRAVATTHEQLVEARRAALRVYVAELRAQAQALQVGAVDLETRAASVEAQAADLDVMQLAAQVRHLAANSVSRQQPVSAEGERFE